MEPLQSSLQKSKQHFEILDGLRGVAAIAVVIFHFMEWVYPDYTKSFIGHGFLAVDFFFCLSGFVIGYAYDDRIAKMGVMEFFKSRLIRLHPLVVFGSVLGLMGFLFDPFGSHHVIYSAGKLALIFLCSVLLIPFPVMADKAFNLFGLNAPAWSLFWEYIANIIYALVLYKINRRYLVVLTFLSALVLFYLGHHRNALLGGWSGGTFSDGGVRMAYSFLAGLLVYRFKLIFRNKLGFTGLAVLLLLAFTIPFFKWDWLVQILIVLFYFPLIVALGAGVVLNKRVKKVCIFSGKISYPLYMTHYFAIWIFGSYFTNAKPATGMLFIVVTVSLLLLIAFAWLIMVFYDMPLRRYLTSKRK